MRAEIIEYIHSNEELKMFLREMPEWYRTLSRNPNELEKFEIASINYFQKTIPHRVQKFSNGVQMASMMISMFQTMNESE
ncbi:YlbE-like family protein [Rossellomorea aquimaris]|uniref:YlbE-like family protein n=1 Tax=Rossellomorea aquimaris TaxID=189382 RepID=UPI001CD6E085|nr:YlbE-like family protein [Rossellomorea aquimaris]MCA1053390.1 YlbE-like family protein [Rossellomorea aquimaris]